jgi:hypothetical protein
MPGSVPDVSHSSIHFSARAVIFDCPRFFIKALMFALIEDYWVRVFGVGAEPGVHVIESNDDWNGVLAVGTPACARICVPGPMVSNTRRIVAAHPPETLLTRAFWEEQLPHAEVLGPNCSAPLPGVGWLAPPT